MKAYRGLVLGLAGVVSLGFSSAMAFAGEDGEDARALRLSSSEGQVQVVQDGQVIADPATANLPLFEGSQIITGNDGRAEIQLEDGGVARISPNSTLTFTVLQQQGSNTRTEMVLNAGLGYFELQPSNSDHVTRVSYGTATFTASSFAVVRLNVDAQPGSLAVFSGDVHLERNHGVKLDIHGGQSLSLDAADMNRYNLSETIETDSWDSWNADQDQALNQQDSQKTAADEYVNNQPAGMSDLDANGNWYNVPGQGLVWSPYIALTEGAAWDPYGYGRWVYYPRYGSVWVSGYNWGYAPYQCGNWNYFDSFGWGWAPGYGCNTWYGGGWGYNIGNYPRGYRPPRRPDMGPIRPRGGPRPGGHFDGGVRRIAVAPVVVDRRPAGSLNGTIGRAPSPIRGGSIQPITVGGHLLQPLRPVSPRQAYNSGSPTSIVNRGGSTVVGRPAAPGYNPGVNGGINSGFGNRSNSGLNPGSGQQPIYRPQQPSNGGNGGYRPQPMPSRPSGGGSMGGSFPRPSGGGGMGGGAPRPMGGGGGGMGGGGGHPAGGGGGSPHK